VVLNEIGADYQIENVSLSEGKNRSPEFLALNPRGQVPVLVDNGTPIREGAAILVHLAEKHKSPLLPTAQPARTAAFEWLMFCNATLHPAYSRGFFLNRNATGDTKEQLLDVTCKQINKLWEEVDARLEKNQYLAGNEITLADILLTVIANWSGNFPAIKIGERTKKLLKTVSSLPSYQKAMAAEDVKYKVA
jgi:glutathione S-transferase